jgi:hypothetical protein
MPPDVSRYQYLPECTQVAEQNGLVRVRVRGRGRGSPIPTPTHTPTQVAEQNGFLDIFYDGGQMSALPGGGYGGDIAEMWGRYGGQISALLGAG